MNKEVRSKILEFFGRINGELGIRAKGRKLLDSGGSFQLREASIPYNVNFEDENNDIGVEDSYLWINN
jgi:hypothetical protein